jgi:hypothetical protein
MDYKNTIRFVQRVVNTAHHVATIASDQHLTIPRIGETISFDVSVSEKGWKRIQHQVFNVLKINTHYTSDGTATILVNVELIK